MLGPNVVKWNDKIKCLNITSIRLDKISNKTLRWELPKIDISKHYI
jgi:hypothetical protein